MSVDDDDDDDGDDGHKMSPSSGTYYDKTWWLLSRAFSGFR